MSIPNFEKRAKMGQETIKLTTAQALVKWLSNQFINIDGKEYHLCGGGFGILLRDGSVIHSCLLVLMFEFMLT